MLIHIGFSLRMVKWIIGYVTTTSFTILINGSTSSFLKSSKGLRQGFPSSSYLLILVFEGLAREIKEEKGFTNIKGVIVGRTKSLTHLLFIDDDVLYYFGSKNQGIYFNNILQLYSATHLVWRSRLISLPCILIVYILIIFENGNIFPL